MAACEDAAGASSVSVKLIANADGRGVFKLPLSRLLGLPPEILDPLRFDGFDRADVAEEGISVGTGFKECTVCTGMAAIVAVQEKVGEAPCTQVILVEMGIHVGTASGRGCVKTPPSLARFKHQLMGALHEAIRRWS